MVKEIDVPAWIVIGIAVGGLVMIAGFPLCFPDGYQGITEPVHNDQGLAECLLLVIPVVLSLIWFVYIHVPPQCTIGEETEALTDE